MVTAELPVYESLKLRAGDRQYSHVYEVQLCRPSHRNALHGKFWLEFHSCVKFLENLPPCRCIIVTADGPVFSAGIDLAFAATFLYSPPNRTKSDRECTQDGVRAGGGDHTTGTNVSRTSSGTGNTSHETDWKGDDDPQEEDCARKAFGLQRRVRKMQDAFTALEECSKPVIVCVTGACIGGAVGLICACDIRLATEDAWFTVKEVDLGIAADLGTLQRLPRVVGNDSWVRDVCLTTRNFHAAEAKSVGLLSDVFKSRDILYQHAWDLAARIASKSPVAVVGTKFALNYATRRSVSEELKVQSIWNSAMLQTVDVPLALKVTRKQMQEKDRDGQSLVQGQIFSNL